MVALCLGTVQIGLSYGVSNTAGQVSLAESERILEGAAAHGVTMLDTAPAYGTSEQMLGTLGAARRFQIITKTPQLRNPSISAEQASTIRAMLESSLAALAAPSVHGLLVHWPGDLMVPGADHVWRTLERAKADGLVASIGVSVYEPAEFDAILERYPIEHVQMPLNVLDQRFVRSGALARARAKGVVVHARSAFLQGLLLMAPQTVPARLAEARPALGQLGKAARSAGISRLAACLGYVVAQPEVDAVVCGVNSLSELDQIVAALKTPPGMAIHYGTLAIDCEDVIDPRRWHE